MKTIGFLDSNLTGNGFTALKVAKQFGYRVIFLSRNLDEYLAINGTKEYFDLYVDEFILYKDSSANSVIESLKNCHLDGLVTFSDYHVALASEVAMKLNLPCLNPESAKNVRNKNLTRIACKNSNIPSPEFIKVRNKEELKISIDKIGLPCIVKPLDESASEGVKFCETYEDAFDQFSYIVNKGKNSRGQETCKEVLVEEYLIGHEISVEVIVKNSKVTFIGCTDKEISGSPYFVEVAHTFPSLMSEDLKKECYKVTKQALDAVKFNFGIAHVELKVTDKGPKIIEINGRPAGDRIADLIYLSTDIDIIKEHISMSVGDFESIDISSYRGASIRFLTTEKCGIIKEIKNEYLLKKFEYIHEYKINGRPGDEIKNLRSNRDRLGYVLFLGDNSYNTHRQALSAMSKINIVMEDY